MRYRLNSKTSNRVPSFGIYSSTFLEVKMTGSLLDLIIISLSLFTCISESGCVIRSAPDHEDNSPSTLAASVSKVLDYFVGNDEYELEKRAVLLSKSKPRGKHNPEQKAGDSLDTETVNPMTQNKNPTLLFQSNLEYHPLKKHKRPPGHHDTHKTNSKALSFPPLDFDLSHEDHLSETEIDQLDRDFENIDQVEFEENIGNNYNNSPLEKDEHLSEQDEIAFQNQMPPRKSKLKVYSAFPHLKKSKPHKKLHNIPFGDSSIRNNDKSSVYLDFYPSNRYEEDPLHGEEEKDMGCRYDENDGDNISSDFLEQEYNDGFKYLGVDKIQDEIESEKSEPRKSDNGFKQEKEDDIASSYSTDSLNEYYSKGDSDNRSKDKGEEKEEQCQRRGKTKRPRKDKTRKFNSKCETVDDESEYCKAYSVSQKAETVTVYYIIPHQPLMTSTEFYQESHTTGNSVVSTIGTMNSGDLNSKCSISESEYSTSQTAHDLTGTYLVSTTSSNTNSCHVSRNFDTIATSTVFITKTITTVYSPSDKLMSLTTTTTTTATTTTTSSEDWEIKISCATSTYTYCYEVDLKSSASISEHSITTDSIFSTSEYVPPTLEYSSSIQIIDRPVPVMTLGMSSVNNRISNSNVQTTTTSATTEPIDEVVTTESGTTTSYNDLEDNVEEPDIDEYSNDEDGGYWDDFTQKKEDPGYENGSLNTSSTGKIQDIYETTGDPILGNEQGTGTRNKQDYNPQFSSSSGNAPEPNGGLQYPPLPSADGYNDDSYTNVYDDGTPFIKDSSYGDSGIVEPYPQNDQSMYPIPYDNTLEEEEEEESYPNSDSYKEACPLPPLPLAELSEHTFSSYGPGEFKNAGESCPICGEPVNGFMSDSCGSCHSRILLGSHPNMDFKEYPSLEDKGSSQFFIL